MRPLESMRLRIRPLGIYSEDEHALVQCEFAACAAALDLAYDALIELEREAFTATAQSWGLWARAELYGVGLSPRCAQALLYLRRVRRGCFTKRDFEQLAQALGLDCTLTEDRAGHTVRFQIHAALAGQVWTEALLRRLLPAQLQAQFVLDEGVQWPDTAGA